MADIESRIALPEWANCYKAVQEGTASPLQVFIYNNEPAGGEQDRFFREQLAALIAADRAGLMLLLQQASGLIKSCKAVHLQGEPLDVVDNILAKIEQALKGGTA